MTKEQANNKIIDTVMELLKNEKEDNSENTVDVLNNLYVELKDVLDINDFDSFYIYINQLVLKNKLNIKRA
jgi:hypothetical protein